VAGALVALVACVGPVRTFDVYVGKAVETAKAVRGAVETARIAASAAGQGKLFSPYLSVILGEAEEHGSGAQGAFSSIQPPDERSDALSRQLGDLVDDAVSLLRDLRIAARRGELDRLVEIADPLRMLSDRLESFVRTHE
jgi:hypothetical protein